LWRTIAESQVNSDAVKEATQQASDVKLGASVEDTIVEQAKWRSPAVAANSDTYMEVPIISIPFVMRM
jgi:hypothetical protein